VKMSSGRLVVIPGVICAVTCHLRLGVAGAGREAGEGPDVFAGLVQVRRGGGELGFERGGDKSVLARTDLASGCSKMARTRVETHG
jgi:hypothetical protein